jgi:hypothetical protein
MDYLRDSKEESKAEGFKTREGKAGGKAHSAAEDGQQDGDGPIIATL